MVGVWLVEIVPTRDVIFVAYIVYLYIHHVFCISLARWKSPESGGSALEETNSLTSKHSDFHVEEKCACVCVWAHRKGP